MQDRRYNFGGFRNVGDDIRRLLEDGRIVIYVFHVNCQIMTRTFLLDCRVERKRNSERVQGVYSVYTVYVYSEKWGQIY